MLTGVNQEMLKTAAFLNAAMSRMSTCATVLVCLSSLSVMQLVSKGMGIGNRRKGKVGKGGA